VLHTHTHTHTHTHLISKICTHAHTHDAYTHDAHLRVFVGVGVDVCARASACVDIS